MAFYKSSGDTVQSNYVLATFKEKSYIIPGVTVNGEAEMPNAEVLKYWVTDASAVSTTGAPGQKQTFSEKALVSKSITLNKRVTLNGIIPGANIATVSADQVNSHVIKDTVHAIGKINEDYITTLETAAEEATTQWSASDVYGSILSLAAEYKVANKEDGLEPTACFVSPTVYASLLKNNLIYFKNDEPASVFPFRVIECPDLTVNAVLLNQAAMASGVAFRDVEVFDAAPLGYAGGTGYIGEICYANAPVEFHSDFTGKAILKF